MNIGKKNKLVRGIGVNDAEFNITHKSGGVKKSIPSYYCWSNMLMRCTGSSGYYNKQPTYVNCTVDEEWLFFTNFNNWYESQYKEDGWQLDKDILKPGNKHYSVDNCIFVSKNLNSFFNDHSNAVGESPLGVQSRVYKGNVKYRARCSNPFTGKREHLGYFDNEIEAHEAWRQRKHELACQYASTVHDERLRQPLMSKYKNPLEGK